MNNTVKKHMIMKRAQLEIKHGVKINLKDAMILTAAYCGVGKDQINSIYMNRVTPSLPVAMRLAKYFNTRVELLFQLDEKEEETINE